VAQANLGFLYQNGLGVPLNYGETYKWFTLAASSGIAASRYALEAITQIMTPKQLREGHARVSDCVSHHNNLELAATES
jgi:TPR repeat protein